MMPSEARNRTEREQIDCRIFPHAREANRAVAEQIAAVQRLANKPVILTEVGFKSINGTSVRPWEWPRRDRACRQPG